jgi:hypothetical protein
VGVRSLVLIVIAIAFAVLQYAWLTSSVIMPHILLALAAWAMVDGKEQGVIWRAWILGFISDVFDPASYFFHSVMFVALALAYIPVRSLIFRSRMTGWAAWAFIASLVLQLTDGWLTSFGDATGWTMFFSACWTAILAVFFGWLLRGLPASWQPVEPGGA